MDWSAARIRVLAVPSAEPQRAASRGGGGGGSRSSLKRALLLPTEAEEGVGATQASDGGQYKWGTRD